MKKSFLIFFLPVIMLCAVACTSNQNATEQAEEANEEKFDDNDDMEDVSEFMVKAYHHNMLLTEASQVAAQQAKASAVKDFARKSLNEHTKMQQQIQSLATQMNISLPDSLDERDRQKVGNLTASGQENFDSRYIELVDDASEEMVEEFEDISQEAKDANVSNFVQQSLPALRQHQQQADQLEESGS